MWGSRRSGSVGVYHITSVHTTQVLLAAGSVLLFTIAITSRDYGTMYKAEMRVRTESKVYRDGAQLPIAKEVSELKKPEGVPLRAINAWLPILVLIVGTIYNTFFCKASPLPR